MTTQAVLLILPVVLVVAVIGTVLVAVFSGSGRSRSEDQMGLLVQAVDRLATTQAEQAGRLHQLAEDQTSAQAQLTRRLEERLDMVSRRLGDGLSEQARTAGETLSRLHERLALIDAAQKNLVELSQQMVGLQDILSNKQARGAFGEIQLNDLVAKALPPFAYETQARLSNGRIADCLLKLPNPPGSIAIDAKFPLESYRLLAEARDDATRIPAGRAFSADVLTHVKAIAEKYIVPGETAESALMFLPSEAIYAELHANFRNVVEESFRRRVWIVSPTTLMATLNTVRAVLKDARMREQAGLIQKEVLLLLEDVARLDKRVENLQTHFGQASRDISDIRISTDKVVKRAGRIEDMQLGEDGPAAELPGPANPPGGVA
jgi:DNA recombination protein RmuC